MVQRTVKMGIALFALVGAMAAFGVGTAAATKLCTVEGVLKTCPAGKEVKVNAPLKLKQAANAQFPIGIELVECAASTLEGEITNAGGGGGVAVKGVLNNFSWLNCNCLVKPLKTPWNVTFEGTGNRDGNMNWPVALEFDCDGVKCEYSDLQASPVKGGSPAVLEVGLEMTKIGGAAGCANPGKWFADYNFTEPASMYVTEK